MLPTQTTLFSIASILEKAAIQNGSQVADLGSGRSLVFLQTLLKTVGRNGTVYAVDVLPDVIESLSRDIAHHGHLNAKAIKGDLETDNGVPLSSDLLEAAFIINTLHQSRNSLGFLQEAKRLLKPGGKLVIVDWDNSQSPFGPGPELRISKKNVEETLEISGFSTLDHFTPGPYHYGIVALVN